MDCIFELKCQPQVSLSGFRNIASLDKSPTHKVIKAGSFFRLFDQKLVQRYRCCDCQKTFSDESLNICKYQKKRHLNQPLFELLCSGASLRRSAHLLRTNRKTIVRKFVFLGENALSVIEQKQHLFHRSHINTMVFDDMESFEHSKCKPLSMTIAVEEKTRLILGFNVASMPAKGLLVKKALKKYGKRKDERREKRAELFHQIKDVLAPSAIIKSDMSTFYSNEVRTFFPNSQHVVFKGRKGCVVGQGELKSGGFDPLFSLNHTAAMFRANVNRLFRRTWNTRKKAMCLNYHMALYTLYHNFKITAASSA